MIESEFDFEGFKNEFNALIDKYIHVSFVQKDDRPLSYRSRHEDQYKNYHADD